MTREELTEKMKDLPNPNCRVNLIQQVWEIMNSESEELEKKIEKMKRCFNCKYHNMFVESKCGGCEDYSEWELADD